MDRKFSSSIAASATPRLKCFCRRSTPTSMTCASPALSVARDFKTSTRPSSKLARVQLALFSLPKAIQPQPCNSTIPSNCPNTRRPTMFRSSMQASNDLSLPVSNRPMSTPAAAFLPSPSSQPPSSLLSRVVSTSSSVSTLSTAFIDVTSATS